MEAMVASVLETRFGNTLQTLFDDEENGSNGSLYFLLVVGF